MVLGWMGSQREGLAVLQVVLGTLPHVRRLLLIYESIK